MTSKKKKFEENDIKKRDTVKKRHFSQKVRKNRHQFFRLEQKTKKNRKEIEKKFEKNDITFLVA